MDASAHNPLQRLIGEIVVLDTGSPVVYIGRLLAADPHTFLLEDADMHDCRDGHATQEAYVAEARRDGVSVNRREVVVMRHVVISVSRLSDVILE